MHNFNNVTDFISKNKYKIYSVILSSERSLLCTLKDWRITWLMVTTT